ncbi:SIR2 family protein [Bradyrhizobium sp. INPA03-11B]|uniref:SIR2 family protein n=1 Tax=Bradyrhizobium sp. INPA03-11B TaxID=418598 RepID=UPI00338E42B4
MDGLFNRAIDRVVSLSDEAVVSELIEALHSEDVTLIVGSAVSLFPPASVVNGQYVTQAIAKHLSRGLPREDVLRKFISKTAFEVILQYNGNDAAIRKWLVQMFASAPPRAPNSIHRAIAAYLAAKPGHVVTTNYDRFIEQALEATGVRFETIISEDRAKSACSDVRYFKIHGCTSDPVSLVFRLDQERPLENWKATTFRSLTEGRTVLVIGYSGKDFEICQALLQNNPKALLWNAYELDVGERRFPSENSQDLLEHRPNMLFIKGDMYDIFEVDPLPRSKVDERRTASRDGVPRSWTRSVRLIKQKSCSRTAGVASIARAGLNVSRGIAYRQRKYRTAIYHGVRLAAARSRGGTRHNFALRAGLDAAFKLRNRGNHCLAKLAFGIAAKGSRRSSFVLHREYAMNMAWFQILDLLRFTGVEERLQRLVAQMEFISLHQGFGVRTTWSGT